MSAQLLPEPLPGSIDLAAEARPQPHCLLTVSLRMPLLHVEPPELIFDGARTESSSLYLFRCEGDHRE